MSFLDVKTDLAFKKVFGSEESKDILISFINSTIYHGKVQQVDDLVIVDPYTIPMLKGMKDSFVDVKARLNDGTRVIIEMQVLNHAGLEKRVLYNVAKNYSVQLAKGEDYTLLNPVIALTIVDFVMFESSKEVINRFKLIEKERFIEYSDDIELIFIELPKFTTRFDDLTDRTSQWLYFLKHAGEMKFVPDSFKAPLDKAFSLIDESSMSHTELEAQHKRKEWIFIQKSSLKLAEDKGREEGLEEGLEQGLEQGLELGLEQGLEKGREEGLEEGRVVVAKNMMSSGMALETISQLTGLTEAQLKACKRGADTT